MDSPNRGIVHRVAFFQAVLAQFPHPRGSGFRNGEYSVASTVGGYGPAVCGSHPLRGQLGLAKPFVEQSGLEVQ